MIDSLGIEVIKECLDCGQYAIRGNWGEFWVCSATVVLGFFARMFEKRKMKRKFRKGL